MARRTLHRIAAFAGPHSLLATCLLCTALLQQVGCSSPGGMAPSTVPLPTRYVSLSPSEGDEVSSCGVAILMLPLANPDPVSDVIQEIIDARGGDALVNVSSESSSTFFLIGKTNCLSVRGTVVRYEKQIAGQ